MCESIYKIYILTGACQILILFSICLLVLLAVSFCFKKDSCPENIHDFIQRKELKCSHATFANQAFHTRVTTLLCSYISISKKNQISELARYRQNSKAQLGELG